MMTGTAQVKAGKLSTKSASSHRNGPIEGLRHWAELTPDSVAYEFVGLDLPAALVTYRELANRSLRAAGEISGPAQQGPVLVLYPPGLDYVVALLACMIAGVPAVPAYPPDLRGPGLDMARLSRLVSDATPTAVLVDRSLAPLLGPDTWPTAPAPRIISLNDSEKDEEHREGNCWPVLPGEDEIAIIQYTSGSTSFPRGVIVRHGDLTHNISTIINAFGLGPESRAVSWLPPYHDMGLVGGILTPLYAGFPIRLMSPLDFLKKPLFWLEHISDMRATASGGPNFAYDLCVRRALNDPPAGELDLSSWSVAFNGAEPIRWRTLTSFADRFASAGFHRRAFFPCYGLAEATLIVSGGHWDGALFQGSERSGPCEQIRHRNEPLRVGCGRTLGGLDVAITDPGSHVRLTDGKEGEVWVRGPGVTTGYWRGRDQDAFGELDGKRYLRTGDLGLLVCGELVISGRLKDVIVYRGANYHSADLEERAAMAPWARPVAAAFAVDDEAGTTVVVAIEARPGCDEPLSLAADVRSLVTAGTGLAPHVIVVVSPGSIPRTSSGKVQRWLCRDMFVSGRLDALVTVRADRGVTDREGALFGDAESLTEVICGVFAAVCGVPSCLPHTTLLELGGDSLNAAEVANVLEAALAVPVPLDLVLAAQTSAALASRLLGQTGHLPGPAGPSAKTTGSS
jgi:acyl-CoA synthetase (AMP-forming)/AMP-acid ligase II